MSCVVFPKGTGMISLKAKCLIKAKWEIKILKWWSKVVHHWDLLKRSKERDKIHWRTDKINNKKRKKEVSKRQSFRTAK